MHRFGRIPLALTLAGAVLLLIAPAAHAGSPQGWYLSPTYTLEPTTPVGESGWVDLANAQTLTFVSADAAVAAFDLSGSWPYSMKTRAQGNADAYEIIIGKIDATNTFVAGAASQPLLAGNGVGVITGTIENVNLLVEEGERLALRVYNTPATKGGGNSVNIQLAVNDPEAGVTSPDTITALPTPELPTLALTAAGIGLVALAAARRR